MKELVCPGSYQASLRGLGQAAGGLHGAAHHAGPRERQTPRRTMSTVRSPLKWCWWAQSCECCPRVMLPTKTRRHQGSFGKQCPDGQSARTGVQAVTLLPASQHHPLPAWRRQPRHRLTWDADSPASDTGTPCSLQTPRAEGSTWGRGMAKDAPPGPGAASWQSVCEDHGKSGHTGEQSDVGRVPHCPTLYQLLLATGQQTHTK